MADKLKYVGGGAFLPGVPARDLDADEVEAHGGEERLVGTGLYVKAQAKKRVAESRDRRPDGADD